MDVSVSVIERCSKRFADDLTMRFRVYDPFALDDHDTLRAGLVLRLAVLFHSVNNDLFEKTTYDLFTAAKQYVIVPSSNYDDPAPEVHVRYRRFTEYVEENFSAFELAHYVKNLLEDRLSDFYGYERAERQ